MRSVKKIIAVFIFIGLIFAEVSLKLDNLWEKVVYKIMTPFYKLGTYFDRINVCVLKAQDPERISIPQNVTLLFSNGLLFLKGEGRVGDVVVSDSGVFIGKVVSTSGELLVVETPWKKGFSMRVTVRSEGLHIEGRLLGGYPPTLEVAQDMDVNGWKVWISPNERFGPFILSKNKGFIGIVKGKKGKFWFLDYKLPLNEKMEVVGM